VKHQNPNKTKKNYTLQSVVMIVFSVVEYSIFSLIHSRLYPRYCSTSFFNFSETSCFMMNFVPGFYLFMLIKLILLYRYKENVYPVGKMDILVFISTIAACALAVATLQAKPLSVIAAICVVVLSCWSLYHLLQARSYARDGVEISEDRHRKRATVLAIVSLIYCYFIMDLFIN